MGTVFRVVSQLCRSERSVCTDIKALKIYMGKLLCHVHNPVQETFINRITKKILTYHFPVPVQISSAIRGLSNCTKTSGTAPT